MAMATCKECKQQISTDAKTCPNCGKSNPTGGWTTGAKVGAVILVLIVLNYVRVPKFSETAAKAAAARGGQPSSPSAAGMPQSQSDLLALYARACAEYDAQPNEIKMSAVYRKSRDILAQAAPVSGWIGTLKRISTNQGGSNATLVIDIGDSDVRDGSVALGSPVYLAASNMREGQTVTFSGRSLSDFNATERGKVCSPDFQINLTSLN